MISCYHLTVHHPRRERPLLDDVSLEIERGEFVEVIAPSGQGKSVLCSILSLRRRVLGAKCIIAGRNLDRLDAAGVAEVRQKIGACTQHPKFLERRSVLENLLLPLVARQQPDRALGKVERLIEQTRVQALAEVPAGGLAAGERRLVGIFRALVGQPPLVVIDGGLEGLGEHYADAARGLRRAFEAGSTVVLAARAASPLDDLRTTTLELRDGRLEPAALPDGDSRTVDGAA